MSEPMMPIGDTAATIKRQSDLITFLRAELKRKDADTELLFQCCLAAMVLRTMFKTAGLNMGRERAEQLIADIGAAHPEFAGRSALRSPAQKEEEA